MTQFDMPTAGTAFTAELLRKLKLTRRGLALNMLLIGENGTGKHAFVNTLCDMQCFPVVSNDVSDEVVYVDGNTEFTVDSRIIQIHETNTVPIRLRVSLTRNFGYNLENGDNAEKLSKYIDTQFKLVLEEEVKIHRNPHVEDNRVHVALYFIRATARGLNAFDIECMKRIGSKVNLIPVISKSDALTDEEVALNKDLINADIRNNDICVYDFLAQDCDTPSSCFAAEGIQPPFGEEVDDDIEYLTRIQHTMPFTIISANEKAGIDAESPGALIRRTPWGDVYLEDENVCDFMLLKNVVFGSHIQEFRETTVSRKYERYRMSQLSTQ